MAFAVVLQRDAQNVWERFYASKDPDDTERLVIKLADAVTDTPANVSDDLYARLRKQISEEQLMQLGAHKLDRRLAVCHARHGEDL